MTTKSIRIVCVQENPTVGAIDANLDIVRHYRETYRDAADLLVFSECFVTGYPLQDLVCKPGFLRNVRAAISEFAEEMRGVDGPAVLVGAPRDGADKPYNAAFLIEVDGSVREVLKHYLPNSEVYDEHRVFASGPMPKPLDFRGVKLGVMICEDFWHGNVARALADEGAEMFVIPNGSHFRLGKQAVREDLARRVVRDTGLPLVYVNQVCGQDELVFDGGSFAMGTDAWVLHRTAFRPDSFAVTLTVGRDGPAIRVGNDVAEAYPDDMAALYSAMVLGLRDYVNKNGFPGIVLGMSGGIDSALSAAVAVDALGAPRVRCVMMPSVYTGAESLGDAETATRMLGARYDVLPIAGIVDAFMGVLAPVFGDGPADTTEENLQARIRGVLLMAISNKFGPMVLSTGNKSEMSVGYATLYGDMCGGYSVLKDLYKTKVFEVSAWRNANLPPAYLAPMGPRGPVMPENIITKKPTAELKPGQTDEGALGSYAHLDAVLEQLVENMADPAHAARMASKATGDAIPLDYVEHKARLLRLAEYKRRQSPPGVSLTRTNLGSGRRFPITNRFIG